jgi:hypothetical protein
MGLTVVAYLFLTLAFGWSVFWFLGLGDALAGSKLPVVFLLFVSYYWVHQVLTNTVHVTVAGVIGKLINRDLSPNLSILLIHAHQRIAHFLPLVCSVKSLVVRTGSYSFNRPGRAFSCRRTALMYLRQPAGGYRSSSTLEHIWKMTG